MPYNAKEPIMDLKTIRKAVTKHRGGLDGASDGQIMLIWNSLDAETKKLYLEPAKTVEPQDTERKSESDAITDKSKSDIQGSARKRRGTAEK